MRRHTFSTLPLRIQAAILAQVACNRISFFEKESQYQSFIARMGQFRLDKQLLTAARRVLDELAANRAVEINNPSDPFNIVTCAEAINAERLIQDEMIMAQLRFYQNLTASKEKDAF
jgi:hypothetical protein